MNLIKAYKLEESYKKILKHFQLTYSLSKNVIKKWQ